jgi:acetate kinase
MLQRYARISSTAITEANIITFQLGNGCSATAIKHGISVDTSMGFTPLEGLIMGTRSGDLDAAIVPYVAKHEGISCEELEGWLNTRSGLLGMSELSADLRTLLDAEAAGNEAAHLAITMFCYRARKYLGAYLTALNGEARAVVFGGGIGENAPSIRARICDAMGWAGLYIDADTNANVVGREARISTDGSSLHAYVVPVDEADVMIQDAIQCLHGRHGIVR